MPKAEHHWSGWQGVALVAITYVYFLIFAQFAFLKRLGTLGIADAHLKVVLAAMAAGGISLSLLSPRLACCPSLQRRIQIGLAVCAVAALLSSLNLGLAAAIAVSLLIGCGLGLLTVSLVTDLRAWLGPRHPLLRVGLGTGIGYSICNFPTFFSASPQQQATVSAALCLAGTLIAQWPPQGAMEQAAVMIPRPTPFPQALTGFTALVWLDSAAFFIIQSTPALKAGTWAGSLHLWMNSLLHLLAALACVVLLRWRGLFFVLLLAFTFLGAACLLLLHPQSASGASLLYPVGVSLYSVALVAYPSLLSPTATLGRRGRIAGWIYAVAGWVGSAMGIGMGQHLGHVPPAFLLVAGVLIALPRFFPMLRRRRREAGATVAVVALAFGLEQLIETAHGWSGMTAPAASSTQIQRGRQVYIAEGCIHCHSQYVRPSSSDVLIWGPTQSIEILRRERPPLIGNRRQGPDLSEVGSRRSPLWLKAHLYNPSQVSYHSFMPSYAYLFRDKRGGELLAYLESLRGGNISAHLRAERMWRPSTSAVAHASAFEGAVLFSRFCATCHEADGVTRVAWSNSFSTLPPVLEERFASGIAPLRWQVSSPTRLAQIVKFGICGTDMPGHEYLSDQDVASIVLWLLRTEQRKPSDQPHTSRNAGEGQ